MGGYDFVPGGIGGDDTPAVQAAINSGNRLIVLDPSKNYRLESGLTWAHTQGELTILAHGATVTYYGNGYAITPAITSGNSGLPSIHVYGGTWIDGGGTAVGLARLGDVRASTWDKMIIKNFGAGPAFTLSNDRFYSERNSFNDLQVRDCYKAFMFQTPGGESSFARTHIHNLLVSGGVAGVCLIDMDDNASVYDSDIGPIHGNITVGAILMKLAGGLGGTVIGPIGVEQTNGTADAYVFQVGTLNTLPTIRGPIKLRSTQLYYGGVPAKPPKWSLNGGSAAPATALGPLVKKVELFDESGASVGFVPIYKS